MYSVPACPPDKCATRLRYTPTGPDPYRNRAFEARGNFMSDENETKIRDAVGPGGTRSPAKSPAGVQDLSAYRPEEYEPQHRWMGEGPPPRRWWAADGTLVYRSYADFCDA